MTDITGEGVVKAEKTQLNDALIACCTGDPPFYHKAQMELGAPLAKGLEIAIESLEMLTRQQA